MGMCIFLDCPGLGLMVYQCFHSHIDDYIASHHQETVSLLLGKGQSNVETVRVMLLRVSLMTYVYTVPLTIRRSGKTISHNLLLRYVGINCHVARRFRCKMCVRKTISWISCSAVQMVPTNKKNSSQVWLWHGKIPKISPHYPTMPCVTHTLVWTVLT